MCACAAVGPRGGEQNTGRDDRPPDDRRPLRWALHEEAIIFALASILRQAAPLTSAIPGCGKLKEMGRIKPAEARVSQDSDAVPEESSGMCDVCAGAVEGGEYIAGRSLIDCRPNASAYYRPLLAFNLTEAMILQRGEALRHR